MTTWLAVTIMGGSGALMLGLAALLWVRLSGYRRVSASPSHPDGEFTIERYHPMARLAGPEDMEFLQRFSNCRPQLAARWERERRKIFRLYLREAAGEFQRLHAAARALVANAPEEHADLVGKLMRQQVTFWILLAKIELRLALGVSGLDARKIVALIEALKADVRPGMAPASI